MIYRGILCNFICSVPFHVKFKSVFLKAFFLTFFIKTMQKEEEVTDQIKSLSTKLICTTEEAQKNTKVACRYLHEI